MFAVNMAPRKTNQERGSDPFLQFDNEVYAGSGIM